MSDYRRGSESSGSSGQQQYKGVRKRSWGKWVSEIREPQRKKRIWLGSYRSAEEAAHAYDAALLCLRGPAANLNFPNERPTLPPGTPGNYSKREVQAAAAAAAAASVGRRFSYSEFMSPKSTSDSSSDEEVKDITYNRDQPTSCNETWRSNDDDPYLYHLANGMLIPPPSYSDNDDSDDDDDDYSSSLWS